MNIFTLMINLTKTLTLKFAPRTIEISDKFPPSPSPKSRNKIVVFPGNYCTHFTHEKTLGRRKEQR